MGFAYKIDNQQGVYFITATVVQWIDVFTRTEYCDIIVKSLKYCQERKGLQIFGWVIMSNHLHLICSCKEGYELSNAIRDFKKFTSHEIVKSIEANQRESRKNWLMWLLKKKDGIEFWQPGNHPEEIRTMEFFTQKLNYIHNNPLKSGWIDIPEAYVYSSARDFYGRKGLIELTPFY